jgi:hypothetical protein
MDYFLFMDNDDSVAKGAQKLFGSGYVTLSGMAQNNHGIHRCKRKDCFLCIVIMRGKERSDSFYPQISQMDAYYKLWLTVSNNGFLYSHLR